MLKGDKKKGFHAITKFKGVAKLPKHHQAI
jgi:hypothetical protein